MALTLRAARINKNLTQAQAGNKIGVSKDVISCWERGITFPDARQIGKILVVYGVKYDDINFLPEESD